MQEDEPGSLLDARLEEELFAELFSQLREIHWILKPNGDIDRFNAAWREYTGLPERVPGLAWTEVFHPDDRAPLVAARTQGIATQTAYEVEARMRRIDGVYRRHLFRVKPIFDGERLRAWLGTGTDVEDARQAQDDRHQAEVLDRSLILLGEALRESSEPAEMRKRATALLGRTLDACRVAYATVDQANGLAFIDDDWRAAPDLRAARGRYVLRDWGEFFEQLVAGETVAISDILIDPRTASSKEWDDWGLRSLAFVPLLQAGQLKAYVLVHSAEPRVWRARELEFIRAAADRLWSALEGASARLAAREIAESSDVLMWSACPDGMAEYFNRSWYEFTGHAPDVPLGDGWRQIVHHTDLDRTAERWGEAVASGSDFQVEHRLRNAAGEYRWMLTRARPIRTSRAEVTRWYGTCVDIQELKENQRHRDLLVNELNHRVKNTLTLIQSMARQSLRNTAEEPRLAFEGRLIALARAHDVLTANSWESAYLDDLVSGVMAPFLKAGEEGRIVLQGPQMRLESRHAVAVTLALHELATNAAKYGALSTEAGRVTISWWLQVQDSNPIMKLLWVEDGGPEVQPPTRNGFGSQLISRGVAQELGGHVQLDYARGGVRCEITAPLPYAFTGAAAPHILQVP